VNKTIDRPLMNSMAIRRYRSADVTNLRGGYWEPFVVITPISNHRDGHYINPNKIAFKYPNFKKNVDSYVHVGVFNSVIKTNAENFEEYVINVFNYMLKDTTSN